MMPTFIASKIIAAAEISLTAGQTKYRVYFVNTIMYASYKASVDSILQTTESTQYPTGYGACIVAI